MSFATRLRHLPVRWAALGLALPLLAQCSPGSRGSGVPGRPSDGLLSDVELQRVVDLQVARNGSALVDFLAHPRPEVRARAALALGSVQDPAAAEGLLLALKDSAPSVRRDAAFALGQLASPAAIVPLTESFTADTEGAARDAVLLALSKIPSADAVAALLSLDVGVPEEPARLLALGRLGAVRRVATKEGQDHLLAHLDAEDGAIRSAAAYYFGRMPEPGVWAPRVSRVREALDGYGKSDPAAMHLLQALGRLGDAADGPRLREWAARAGDWRVRANAVTALGSLAADPENRKGLLAALDDPSPLVGVAAAQALAMATPVPSELPLIKTWIDAHPDRWQAAAPLLGLLARADEREYVFAWLDATSPDDGYRWAFGVQALAFIPGDGAVERLGRAVASPDPRVQGTAAGTLAQRWSQDRDFSGSTEAYFPVFSNVLRGGAPQAAVAAARALGDPLFAPLGSGSVLVEAYRNMDPATQLEPMMAILDALDALGLPRPQPEEGEEAGVGATGRGVESGATPAPAVDWGYLATLGTAPRLTLETGGGRIVIRLDPEQAPLTVQTIARLAADGRFDGVPFHRVVPNFVAQGGDFSTGDGFGGAGFTIRSEFTLTPFQQGVVGMASAGKDTEGSQFFIMHSSAPHLDGSYTSFGVVVKGQEAVDRLMVGDRITRATVEPGG